MDSQYSMIFFKINSLTHRLLPLLNIWILNSSVKWPLSKIGFQDQLSLNAGQKYCRMFQVEHSAILPTCIKLPFVIKIFVLSIIEWPFYTGFTVVTILDIINEPAFISTH